MSEFQRMKPRKSTRQHRSPVFCGTLALLIVAIAVLGSSGVSSAQQPQPGPPFELPVRGGNPKLDGTLKHLVERLRSESPAAVAARAPASKNAAVAVSIRSTAPERLAVSLTASGITVANVGADVVEAYVRPEQLEFVAGLSDATELSAIIPPQPDVTSQGATVHGSPNWNSFGMTGTGVKVGIIDVGFVGYSGLIGSELPTPAAVRCYTSVGTFSGNLNDCQSATVHGTAVAESVIDVAPGATLYVSNPISSVDLLNTVNWMAAQGVQVINMSLQWVWDGPGDGTSIYASSPLKAVEAATAAGIVWVNSAGNANQDMWSGSWSDTDADQFLEFQPGQEVNSIFLTAGQQVIVQARWEDTWGTAARDLDLYLYNSSDSIVAGSTAAQSGQAGAVPWEAFSYTAAATGSYRVVVHRFAGTPPSWVQVHDFGGSASLSLTTSGRTISNPAEGDEAALLAVGAANWANTSTIESFSSQGPTRDGRVKPDVTAADCADTVSYGANSFCGTSQASPHVAGMVALLRQRYPAETAIQLADRVRNTAAPRGTVPNNTWGAGFAQLPAIAGQLAFTQQPGNGTAGQPLSPQPRIELRNSAGALITTDNSTQVTLAVSGPGSPALTCTGGLTKTVTAGVAQFAGCSITPAANGYTIRATPSCDCLPATSAAFNVAAATNKLTFTTQPSHGVTNQHLASQPVVAVQTAAGVTVSADNTTQVTLSSVPAGVSCTGGLQVTVVAGVASFSGCRFAATGTYMLHAEALTAVAPADSNMLEVTGPPSKLAFGAQPGGGPSGVALSTQPIVLVQDVSGATVLADQATLVSLTLNSPSAGGPGVLSCSGGAAMTAVNGVASFAGCTVTGPGVNFSLRASAASITDVDSSAFSVFGAATTLVFSVSPTTGAPGSPLSPQPVIQVRDALGTLVTTDTSTVTLSLVAGGGPGSLTCTGGLSKAAVAGQASFAGCSISAGGNYQLHATAASRTPADSALFTVVAVGPAAKLTFLQYPANAISTRQFAVQPIVAVQDASGNTVTTDNTTQVTLSMTGGGGGTIVCASNTVTVASGVATFSSCFLVAPGTYTMHATGGGLQGAASTPFVVYPAKGVDWYFAEGFTGLGWSTELHLLNPNTEAATVMLNYLPDSGAPVARTVTIPAQSKRTVDAGSLAEGPGPNVAFGVHIASDIPIVAEEQMYAGANGDFAHGTQGALAPSEHWYFAEGFTEFGWETFVLVANVGSSAVDVTITYQVQGGGPVSKTVSVAAGARHTFLGHIDVPNEAFSVTVTALFGHVVAEMAMYDPARAIAHRTVGSARMNHDWLLGEGFTGFGWETFISVGNDDPFDATVTATYNIDGDPTPVVKTIVVPAHSRGTFIAHETATGVGIGKAFGVRISSTRPVVVQQVLIDPASGASRANSTMGAPFPSSKWSFSGGDNRPGMVTFITVLNFYAIEASVTATYYFDDGTPPAVQNITIAPSGRATFASSAGIPTGKRFGVVVSCACLLVAQEAVYDEPRVRAFSAGGLSGP